MRLRSLLRNLVNRDRVERDLDDEMRAAFDLLVEEKRRAGLSAADATRAAAVELRIESVKAQVREVRAGALFESFLSDLRYAARLLRRNPVFAITAALSLSIGIAATTTVFTVVNGLLLRSAVGVTDPASLVDIVRMRADRGAGIDEISYPDYLEIRRRATTVDEVYAYQLQVEELSLRVTDSAERVFASAVTTNYFRALGVPAMYGRVFGIEDGEQMGASPVAVLSHRFWVRRFDSDPSVVGRTVHLNGHPFTIVGVSREDFGGMTILTPDLWIPVAMIGVANAESAAPRLTSRESDWLMLGARRKPGVSIAQASAEMASIGAALAREFPLTYQFIPPGMQPGDFSFRWSAERSSPIPSGLRAIVAGFLTLLLAIVSIVLVIACANLAGVLLARATVRRREIAVRTAIGAGRAHIVRQLLTETLLLFVVGGATGLALARVLTVALLALLPAFPLPVTLSTPLDGRVVAFSLLVSLAAAMASGLAPAFQAAKTDVLTALKDDSQNPPDRMRLRNAFVVAQVAFSILLVMTSAILVRALDRVTSVDRGFDARGVEFASMNLSMAGLTDASGAAFARSLLERVRALPGVETATLADRPPGPGSMSFGGITVPGTSPPNGQPFFYMNWTFVESDYFATLRIPFVDGRDFTAGDRTGSRPVAILGEAAARRFWPGGNAIGQSLRVHSGNLNAPNPPSTAVEVVGVVRDVRSGRGPGGAAPLALYVPLQQRYMPGVSIFARAAGGQRVTGDLRNLITSMNPNLPVLQAQTLESQQRGPVDTQLRIAATVAGSVGLVGLLLAAVGIYGVTAYVVARRTREIGIRVSLGARRSSVIGLVLRQGMGLVAIGSVIGLALGAGAGVVLGARLGAPRPDALMFAGSALLFALVGLLACYVPARRATEIGAMDALRSE
jgi:predicted permease